MGLVRFWIRQRMAVPSHGGRELGGAPRQRHERRDGHEEPEGDQSDLPLERVGILLPWATSAHGEPPCRISVYNSLSIPDGWEAAEGSGLCNLAEHGDDLAEDRKRLLRGDDEGFHRGMFGPQGDLITLLAEPLHGRLIP